MQRDGTWSLWETDDLHTAIHLESIGAVLKLDEIDEAYAVVTRHRAELAQQLAALWPTVQR
jgi:hypothetical protein